MVYNFVLKKLIPPIKMPSSKDSNWLSLYKHLFLVCGNPISRGKPFVNLDVLYTVLEVAIAFSEVHLEQVTQQVL